MKLVSLRITDLKNYTVDPEMLQKAGRPCVLIVKLTYKNAKYDFAVPLRSNINPSAPKDQYFPLPTRGTTKPKYRHGIHYIKMFPVKKSMLLRYRTEGNAFATNVKNVIDSNERQIVRECQEYLDRYAAGDIPQYATNIDLLLKLI